MRFLGRNYPYSIDFLTAGCYTDSKEREFEGKIIKFLEDNKIEIKYGDGFLIVKASEVLLLSEN